MPSKNTKIVSMRVPERVRFNCSVAKLVTYLYDMTECGALKIENGEIVLPESEDTDGEWVRDMAHQLNVDVKTLKRKIEGMAWK